MITIDIIERISHKRLWRGIGKERIGQAIGKESIGQAISPKTKALLAPRGWKFEDMSWSSTTTSLVSTASPASTTSMSSAKAKLQKQGTKGSRSKEQAAKDMIMEVGAKVATKD